MSRTFRIGDLAAATGAKVNTIRFYEEIGLMPRAARTPSGRRTYELPDLRRLRFIRYARNLGFNTKDIRSLLSLADQPERACGEVTQIAQRHASDVRQKISQLERLLDELDRIACLCAGGTAADCRILEMLSDGE